MSELTTLSSSEFQTVGAATENSSRNSQPRCYMCYITLLLICILTNLHTVSVTVPQREKQKGADLQKSHKVGEDESVEGWQSSHDFDGFLGRRKRINTSAVILARDQWLTQLAVPQLQQRRRYVGVANCVIVGWHDPVIALAFQRRHYVRVARNPTITLSP